MSQSPHWSADRVAALSKLWLDGLSAAQIARQLGGVTRNAVIGKIHRLGLSGRPATPARRLRGPPAHPAPLRSPRPRQVPALKRALTIDAATEDEGLVRDLADLGAHACKWPIGDPKAVDFSFCGRPAEGRYCQAHERRGVRPGTRLRIDRDPVVRAAVAGNV